MLFRSDWRRLTEATGRLVGIPFTVCEDRQMSPSSLRHQVQQLHRPSGRDKFGLIVVDALHPLMDSCDSSADLNSSAALLCAAKELSDEYEVPIVVLVQVHGDLGSGLNTPPITKDLGEIDKVSGPADKILLMYRDGDIKPEAGERSERAHV